MSQHTITNEALGCHRGAPAFVSYSPNVRKHFCWVQMSIPTEGFGSYSDHNICQKTSRVKVDQLWKNENETGRLQKLSLKLAKKKSHKERDRATAICDSINWHTHTHTTRAHTQSSAVLSLVNLSRACFFQFTALKPPSSLPPLRWLIYKHVFFIES